MNKKSATILTQYIPAAECQDPAKFEAIYTKLQALASADYSGIPYLLGHAPAALHYAIMPTLYQTFVNNIHNGDPNPNVLSTSNGFVPSPDLQTPLVPDNYNSSIKNFVYLMANAGMMGQFGIILEYSPYVA